MWRGVAIREAVAMAAADKRKPEQKRGEGRGGKERRGEGRGGRGAILSTGFSSAHCLRVRGTWRSRNRRRAAAASRAATTAGAQASRRATATAARLPKAALTAGWPPAAAASAGAAGPRPSAPKSSTWAPASPQKASPSQCSLSAKAMNHHFQRTWRIHHLTAVSSSRTSSNLQKPLAASGPESFPAAIASTGKETSVNCTVLEYTVHQYTYS